MLIEFDPAKQAKNLRDRGIGLDRFAELDFDTAISIEAQRKDYGEIRLRVLGYLEGKLHADVLTPRGERIRVISLRRARAREVRAYANERESA